MSHTLARITLITFAVIVLFGLLLTLTLFAKEAQWPRIPVIVAGGAISLLCSLAVIAILRLTRPPTVTIEILKNDHRIDLDDPERLQPILCDAVEHFAGNVHRCILLDTGAGRHAGPHAYGYDPVLNLEALVLYQTIYNPQPQARPTAPKPRQEWPSE